MENLIAGIHFLDATIGAKELVYLPPELIINFPPEGNVSYLRCGNDHWNDVRKDANWYMDNAFRGCRRVLNFSDLYDGVDEEKKVEQSMTKCQKGAGVFPSQLT